MTTRHEKALVGMAREDLEELTPPVAVIGSEECEHIRICAERVEGLMGRKMPWHQVEEAWRPLADALKKEGLMR